MPIIRNLKKDFEEGRMDNLRSVSYKETGTEAPYVSKPIGSSSNQITKRIDDLARMGKMLLDRPGLEHLAKEGILKQGEITDKLRRNEKYKNGTDVGNFLRRATGTLEHLLLVTGSTLAQVPVNGTGTHFVRGFKRDTYLQESAGFKTPVAGSTYSLEGARIPMTEVNSESKLPTKNTTALPGDLGKLNIGTEGKLKPSYGEEGIIKPKYSALSTFTDTTTELNVEKSSTGTGINIQKERSEDTTVAKETLGISNESRVGTIGSTFERKNTYSEDGSFTGNKTSENANQVQAGNGIKSVETRLENTTVPKETLGISNKDVEGTLESNFSRENKYTEGNTFTSNDTLTNANNVQTGASIPKPEGLNRNTTASPKTFGILNKDIEGDITELSPKTENTFTETSTYNKTSTKDNINNVQGQNNKKSAAGVVGGKTASNAGVSNVQKSSKEIGITGEYDGSVSSLGSGKQIQDFRSKKATNDFRANKPTPYFFDYNNETINKEQRVGLGDPGNKSRIRTSYSVDDPTRLTVDKINALDVSDKPLDSIKENRDLIQLEFQVITPEETHYLAFRAFLDTFDDSFNASWNSSKYLGRADSFYTYNGFERSINIGFKIAAQTREEMKPLYRKAATLASVTAPSYGTGGRFMRGTIAKVTVGDYIYEQPGIIESVQYTWQKDYPWEISFQNPEGKGSKDQILPHVLDVSISFKVIHDFLPETGVTPFITNHRPIKGNKENYIPLVDREFIIPETTAEKREKAAKEEAEKKEAAAKAKIEAEKAKKETDSSTGENTNTTTDQGSAGSST
jgi:hypothetical protein